MGLLDPMTDPAARAAERRAFDRIDKEFPEAFSTDIDRLTVEEIIREECPTDALREEIRELEDFGREYIEKTDANHDALSAENEKLQEENERLVDLVESCYAIGELRFGQCSLARVVRGKVEGMLIAKGRLEDDRSGWAATEKRDG